MSAGGTAEAPATLLDGVPDYVWFNSYLELAVQYEDQTWIDAGGVDEHRLRPYYWNGMAWIPEMWAREVDASASRLLVNVNHLSLWTLTSPTHDQVMLPLVERKAHRY